MTTARREYSGVILAAGKGSRMAPFGDHFPKPILPICNKPLIAHQIEIMKSVGISDILVLVGHKGFEISKVLGDGSALGIRVRYAEQTAHLGIAHAVGCLERHLRQPFLLFLGDIFFREARLDAMFQVFESQGGGAVLAVKDEPDPEMIRRNFSVLQGDDGRVIRVIEKPRYATNRLKGVGLYLFDLTVFDAIRRTHRTAMRDEYEITDSIQVMIDDGHPVRPAFSVKEDVNMTFPADLLRCNLEQAALAPGTAMLGEHTSIHPEARLDGCIIGSRVRIERPLKISRSLVFPDTVIDQAADLDGYVVAPDCMVDCRRELLAAEAAAL